MKPIIVTAALAGLHPSVAPVRTGPVAAPSFSAALAQPAPLAAAAAPSFAPAAAPAAAAKEHPLVTYLNALEPVAAETPAAQAAGAQSVIFDGASAAPAAPVAAPMSPVDAEITGFLSIIDHLGTLERNAQIEAFYTKNVDQLGWPQVQRLLRALKYYGSVHYNDETRTKDRIVEGYFMRRSDASPALAVEIASRHDGALERNRLLERHLERKQTDLGWADAKLLIDGLKYYSSVHYNDETRTRSRMVESYMRPRLSTLSLEPAIAIARYHPDPLATNKLLEEYFEANRTKLGWAELKKLLDGIKYYSRVDYHDETRTRERIIKAAGVAIPR